MILSSFALSSLPLIFFSSFLSKIFTWRFIKLLVNIRSIWKFRFLKIQKYWDYYQLQYMNSLFRCQLMLCKWERYEQKLQHWWPSNNPNNLLIIQNYTTAYLHTYEIYDKICKEIFSFHSWNEVSRIYVYWINQSNSWKNLFFSSE